MLFSEKLHAVNRPFVLLCRFLLGNLNFFCRCLGTAVCHGVFGHGKDILEVLEKRMMFDDVEPKSLGNSHIYNSWNTWS
jgi:hypothetical protein